MSPSCTPDWIFINGGSYDADESQAATRNQYCDGVRSGWGALRGRDGSVFPERQRWQGPVLFPANLQGVPHQGRQRRRNHSAHQNASTMAFVLSEREAQQRLRNPDQSDGGYTASRRADVSHQPRRGLTTT